MEKIKWYNLDDNGFIIDKNNYIINPLSTTSGVYIYKFGEEDSKLYIGSTINFKQRFKQHRYRAKISSESKKLKYNSIFYKYVNIYGWRKFKYGILEHFDNTKYNWSENKSLLFKLEQKYMDKYLPELNINKTAGSMLGYRYMNNKEFIIPYNNLVEQKTLSLKSLNKETILKQKLHGKNITVFLLDKNNDILKEFNRIKLAADYVGLDRSSVSGYIKNGKLWKNLYYFKLKTNSVLGIKESKFLLEEFSENSIRTFSEEYNLKSYKLEILYNNNIIYKFKSIRQASIELNISKPTILKYSKNNQLWNNKFQFRVII